jgi:hypothetical protein
MPVDPKQKFVWLFLPVVVIVVVVGGYWIWAHTPHGSDRSYAKNHPMGFLAANSAGEAMFQLDACLLQYALVKGDDAFPDDLEAIGPDGIRCASADITSGLSRLNYRFAYYPAAHDAKGKPRGFLLYAYPLLTPSGQVVADSTSAEYFANEEGVVLVRKDFGTSKEHIEPFLGLPKTLQVLIARFVPSKRLPTDQPGMLEALGNEGSGGVFHRPARIPGVLDYGRQRRGGGMDESRRGLSLFLPARAWNCAHALLAPGAASARGYSRGGCAYSPAEALLRERNGRRARHVCGPRGHRI